MYRTKQIADLVGLHPNTIRIYEEWGFISPVPRQANNYRVYSQTHLLQLQIAKRLFRCEIVQGNLRHRARQIVYSCAGENYTLAGELTEQYMQHLETEYQQAVSAAQVVERWLARRVPQSSTTYSRRQAARILQTTPEALRSWERNGLISIPRNTEGHRRYGAAEMERLQIIRGLRSAHYSISAVLRLLSQIHQPDPDVVGLLDTPNTDEEISHVTDRLISSLSSAKADAADVLAWLHDQDKKGSE